MELYARRVILSLAQATWNGYDDFPHESDWFLDLLVSDQVWDTIFSDTPALVCRFLANLEANAVFA